MISAEAAKMLVPLILYLPVHRKDGPHTKEIRDQVLSQNLIYRLGCGLLKLTIE